MTAAVIFWASLMLLVYAYLGYPALIGAWALLRPRPTVRGAILPTVTIVVVAHNEAERIEARIENLRSLDYPRGSLGILIVSDGSTDGTAERARAGSPGGMQVIAFAARRGKPAVLNEIVLRLRGDIVVLADARQRFDPGALRALVAPFADREVGAVSGDLVLTGDGGRTAVGQGVSAYRRYESFVRLCESRVGSTVGATGAICAIRRTLFSPLPQDTILDDVLIPMRIARRGYRVLFEPAARAFDRAPGTAREEFGRKARTLAGNFQLLFREKWLLNPLGNPLWLQAVSHKGLRLLGPALLLAAFASNLFLVSRPGYGLTLLAQVTFYTGALLGGLLRGSGRVLALFSLPYTFCLANGAALAGAFRFLASRQRVTWDKTSA
ncbi:MAG TPA: glycosyltransferase family 2 protein [Candidatus Polarisedimenticolia bacterium]|jgi:cellulose synthase/poly-beta-1,6-N-acetylglucosamine synthase-like glycosyltransferase|nr:glycosyltransferase family 2 protein [Candidatus Polarisedimenticolia bacterium]